MADLSPQKLRLIGIAAMAVVGQDHGLLQYYQIYLHDQENNSQDDWGTRTITERTLVSNTISSNDALTDLMCPYKDEGVSRDDLSAAEEALEPDNDLFYQKLGLVFVTHTLKINS